MATQENLDRVQQLYVAYYGRPADQEGQEYWADRLEAEGEGAIINAFGNSEEYAERFGDQTNADAINTLYNQMFDRNAEPNGLAYWVGVLDSGEKTLAEIATTILNAAGGQDQQIVNAKVAAAAEYTAEFGAAADYDLETALAVVADEDGGIYQPELTTAIETLLTAEQAMTAFLAEADGDDDEETSTDEAALRLSLTGAEATLNALDSENQLNADLQDAQDALETAQANIEDEPGLRKAVADYQASEVALSAANDTAFDAAAELAGEETAFTTRNGNVTVNADGTATYNDGTNDIPFIVLNDKVLEIDQTVVDAQELEGVEALLADIQADLAAKEAVADAQEVRNEELQAVFDLEGSTVVVDENVDPSTVETPLLQAKLDAEADIELAQTALDERAEAAADVAEAQELVNQFEALESDIEDAEEAIADLGVDLNDANTADTEDDLYIFDAETGQTTGGATTFSFEGEDLFFIGNAFSRVDLEENDDVLVDNAFGESGTLEVFFQQNGTNVDVFFESEAFQGNATNGFEGDTITLTGVSVEDLQLENGYISIA